VKCAGTMYNYNVLSQKVVKITVSCLVLILAVFLFVPIPVQAQDVSGTDAEMNLDAAAGQTVLEKTDPRIIVGNIIKVALGLLGAVALIIVLYAGFVYMTSGGDAAKIEKAKKWLVNGFIGMVIIFAAYSITVFIFNMLLGEEAKYDPSGYFAAAGLPGGGYNISGGAFGHIIQSHYPEPDQKDLPRNTMILVTFKNKIYLESVINKNDNLNCPKDDDGNPIPRCGEIKKNAVRIYKCEDMMDDNDLDEDQTCEQVPFYDIKDGKFCDTSADCGGGQCLNETCSDNKLVPGYAMMTEDQQTIIFNPFYDLDMHLGSEDEDVTYIVYLTPNIKKENAEGGEGSGVFNSSYPDYKWRFTTGTFLDLTPPQISSVVPVNVAYPVEEPVGCNCSPKKIGCSKTDCDGKVYLNQGVYINFNEPVIPPLTQTQNCDDGDQDNEVQVVAGENGDSLPGCSSSHIPGGWKVGINKYRTVQFMAGTECADGAKNSCGEAAFCLPTNADITGKVLAAKIVGEGIAIPGTGIVDMGGNSLDGNENGVADGPGLISAEPEDLVALKDNFFWGFLTGNVLDLLGPGLTGLDPLNSKGEVTPVTLVNATFDEDLDGYTVDTEVYLYGTNGDGSPFDPNYGIEQAAPVEGEDPPEPVIIMNKITMSHAPFKEYDETEESLPIYTPIIKSELKDSRFNCFSPTKEVSSDAVDNSDCWNDVGPGESCCPQDGTFRLNGEPGEECPIPIN